MHKDELKKRVCAAIDGKRNDIICIGETIWRTPELAFHEYRTADLLTRELHSLGLNPQTGLAVTGCRADLKCANEGPTVALLGELDAVVIADHPAADPQTGAVHACAHHVQCAALIGAAIGLTAPGVKDRLSGTVAFLAVPAEEHQAADCYRELMANDRIQYTSGKQQLLHEGIFDDVAIAMMIHGGQGTFSPSSFNGFIMKEVIFKGKTAHAGLSPSSGINALSMARLALNAIDFQRDTFNDEDSIRIHGIITDGGKAVNVVPGRAGISLQIRGRTPKAIEDAAVKVDRSLKAAAMALNGSLKVRTRRGYMPFKSCRELELIHEENLRLICPDAHFSNSGHRPSSTDMGDVSMIIPSLHAYTDGMSGLAHQIDFWVIDQEKAYIHAAKLLAMNVIDLLYGKAASGLRIAALPTELTREEYFNQTASPLTEYTYP